jgi:dipeptidyl aminopeptidase/acylaminoacyl peptidase
MDLPRNLPGTPASRALLRGARDLLWLAAAIGIVSSLLVLLTWLAVRNLERNRPAVSGARPASSSVRGRPTAQEVAYESHGARIAARLYLPRGDGPHPALVVAHGSGQSRRSQYDDLAGQLLARGYAFLTYDKRGVGDSEGTYSGIGPQSSAAMFDLLADDVIAGIDYLTRRGDIHPERIGVIGISQGGWIGPLAAAKSRAVSFLVIVSGPAVSVGEEIYYSELTGEREGGSRVGSDGELTSRLAEFQGSHGFDPVPVLRGLEVPGLWILGAGDRSIPIPETVERLESLIAAGKPFTLQVLPDVGHEMRNVETGRPAPVVSIAADWLAATVAQGL